MTLLAPTFNMAAAWWSWGNSTSNPPDANIKVQLYYNSRAVLSQVDGGLTKLYTQQIIRYALADYIAMGVMQTGSIWQIVDALGFGWYYVTLYWDACHRGFPNEYIECVVTQCDASGNWPDPGR